MMPVLTKYIPAFLILGVVMVAGNTTSHAAQYTKPYGELKEVQKFKDYTVRIYRNEKPPLDSDTNPDHRDGFGCFEILRSNQQVYYRAGVIFKVGSSVEDGEIDKDPVKMGLCILGDKEPDLVISERNSGNNYFCDFYVFRISKTFKFMARIKDSGGGEFKDLRGDGSFDLITEDVLTFDGWNCCNAFSPYPTVILGYQNGRYLPDLEMMKKPAPSEQELKKMAATFRARFADCKNDYIFENWSAPYEMWGEMLDLIYSGNMKSAWRLCDLSWPTNYPGKAVFLKEFKKQLGTFKYYGAIKELNHET